MAKIIYQKYQNNNMESKAYKKWYAGGNQGRGGGGAGALN